MDVTSCGRLVARKLDGSNVGGEVGLVKGEPLF